MRRHAPSRIGLAAALTLATVATLADTVATLGLRWVSPTWLFVCVGGAITALAVWSVRGRGRRVAAVTALGGIAWFSALYVWPLTPRKLFFRDMQRIEVGMSRDEVAHTAREWRRTPPGENLIGWPVGPDCEHWLHGQGGYLLSSDHCVIRYANERVASIEFMFD